VVSHERRREGQRRGRERHRAAHDAPTRLTAEVEGYGPKRAEARKLGRGGRPSERDQRLALVRREIARRKRDRETLALYFVAAAVLQDEKQLRRDVHDAGWPRWPLFVAEVPPAD
jgi:hypothetical protein